MIIRNRYEVDCLYALFLGRMPENNFVREENIGRPLADLVEATIESQEFEREILERFTSYGVLPHRELSLQMLPDVLQLIADAELAPPHEGLAPGTWQEALRRVLGAPPSRNLLEVRYGKAGRDLIDRLGGPSSADQPKGSFDSEAVGPTPRSGIAAGAEIIADTIVDRSNPNALLHLKVKVNGSTAKIIAADEFRRDVQQLYGGEGRGGFSVRLDLLADVACSNRAVIEIVELSRGVTVLPERSVELRADWPLRMQAELCEALAGVRKCLDRLQIGSLAQNDETEPFARVKRFFQARPTKGDLTPVTHELPDLIDALGRLERWLPRLEQRQCWALPFYSVMHPILQLVASPPSADGSISLSIVVIDDPFDPEKTAATLASVAAQTHKPQKIFLIATADAIVAHKNSIDTLTIVRLPADRSPENAANELASRMTCSHLIILDAGVALIPEALAWFAAAIARTRASLVYTDEELLTHDAYWGKRFLPLFKPALDYDLILQRNYIGDTFCIERQAYINLAGLTSDTALDARHDLLLRAMARFGRDAVIHLPLLLISRPATVRAEPPNAAGDRTRGTVQCYLDRMETHAKATAHADPIGRTVEDAVKILWHDDPTSLVSVIVPIAVGVDMVFTLISSLRRHADNWDRIEVIVVVNGDIDARQRLGFSEVEKAFNRTRIVYWRAAFNWCEINNVGVERADQDGILMFLNDDMVRLTSGWDTRLRSQLARPEIGVVGGRLLYPNGAIQHVGIAFGLDGTTAHEAMGDAVDHGLYLDRTLLVHEVGAVTGAFLTCRRTLFDEVGGFDAQRYTITSGDADFCVRVRNTGRSVIYDPFLTWIHYESVSRGQDAHDYRKEWRAAAEHDRWRSRFSAPELVDLSNNPHVSFASRPFEVFHTPSSETVELWLEAQRRLSAGAAPGGGWLAAGQTIPSLAIDRYVGKFEMIRVRPKGRNPSSARIPSEPLDSHAGREMT
jgi:GT2 family glycosyltransferase